MSKRKVIIDTDPGYDDCCAIAIAALSDKVEIIGITSVAGNQTIEKVTKNALNISTYFNLQCPVAQGMTGPLLKPLEVALVHGESGLDNINLETDNPKKELDKRHAVNLIIDLCLQNDKVTIIAIGPLTNVAMALKLEPKIISHIELLSIMGGSINLGNVTPSAEFNIHGDPEAAQIVFSSGLKEIRMNGLDVTLKTNVDEKIVERFEKIKTKTSEIFLNCMKNCADLIFKFFGVKYQAMHDAVAVVSVIDDSVVKYKKVYVEVDINRGCSYGRTVCDMIGCLKKEPNVNVGVEIDLDKFWDIVENAYKKL